MRKTYDVIGIGEGIAGLLACTLLAARGLSCLWIDSSPESPGASLAHDAPLLLTGSFFRDILTPVLSRLDRRMVKGLGAEQNLNVQWADTEGSPLVTFSARDVDTSLARGRNRSYISLLGKSLSRPGRYLRELNSRPRASNGWERAIGAALSSPEAGRLSLLRTYASTLGMCAVEHGRARAELEDCLRRGNGASVRTRSAETVMNEREILGVRFDDVIHQAGCYLIEALPVETPYSGFYLYGRCRAPLGMLPDGMGDLLILSPPPELKYPLILKVNRNPQAPTLSVSARVHVETGLTSVTETVSWASGMAVKRISRLLPFFSTALQAFEIVNPMEEGAIRPWFRFSEDVRPPSLFRSRHYIRPREGTYALDRDKYACLGNDGDFFWGICIANALLNDLGRSDIFTPQ